VQCARHAEFLLLKTVKQRHTVDGCVEGTRGGGIEVKKSGQFNNSGGTKREGTQRHDSK
jgi:hypothetical protein